MLEQLGWRNIKVLDRLPPPKPSQGDMWGNADRSYNLGVTERGLPLLDAIGATERVRAASTPLLYRSQWTPQKPDGEHSSRTAERDSHAEPTLVCDRRRTGQLRRPLLRTVSAPVTSCLRLHIQYKAATRDTAWRTVARRAGCNVECACVQLLQRDRLVACLHEHVAEQCEHVSVEHGVTVHDVSVRGDGMVEAHWRNADGTEGTSQAHFLVRARSRPSGGSHLSDWIAVRFLESRSQRAH